jgi:hypothetical protein
VVGASYSSCDWSCLTFMWTPSSSPGVRRRRRVRRRRCRWRGAGQTVQTHGHLQRTGGRAGDCGRRARARVAAEAHCGPGRRPGPAHALPLAAVCLGRFPATVEPQMIAGQVYCLVAVYLFESHLFTCEKCVLN